METEKKYKFLMCDRVTEMHALCCAILLEGTYDAVKRRVVLSEALSGRSVRKTLGSLWQGVYLG